MTLFKFSLCLRNKYSLVLFFFPSFNFSAYNCRLSSSESVSSRQKACTIYGTIKLWYDASLVLTPYVTLLDLKFVVAA